MDERTDENYASAIDAAAFVLLLRERGVRDTAVLRAMEQVPREVFAPPHLREHARRDIALPLPCGQTMTAPTTVAAMLIALGMEPGPSQESGYAKDAQVPSPVRERDRVRGQAFSDGAHPSPQPSPGRERERVAPTTADSIKSPPRVLEIGTGSGYVTALLLRLGAAPVRSLERYDTLARAARGRLGDAALVETADGLAEGAAAPNAFARILVNGLMREVPQQLCAALAPGGRLVGGLATREGPCLVTVERSADGALSQRMVHPIRICPLTAGRARVL